MSTILQYTCRPTRAEDLWVSSSYKHPALTGLWISVRGDLNSTLNRPVPISALDDNRTRHVHLREHFVDFGNGERGEEGIHNRTFNETW